MVFKKKLFVAFTPSKNDNRPVRDIFVTLVVLGFVPLIFRRPYVGALVYYWLSFMNPHRLTWGFAQSQPFALIIALATLVSLFFSGEWRRIPRTRETMVLLLFVGWMFFTTQFAYDQVTAAKEWSRVWKIQLMVVVSLALLQERDRIIAFVWVIALSLGFYGVKGGLFTLLGGGENLVWGPPGSFIEGNNEIGLAMLMTLPLLRFLQMSAEKQWVKNGCRIALILTGVSILGTHSRGAFVGVIVMLIFLAWKSRQRLPAMALVIIMLPLGLLFMPESWQDRMRSIRNYEQDTSAMGRINSWQFAWNLAKGQPIVAGGFGAFNRDLFEWYAPNPDDVHDAHSIYFEVLAEHGFIGLFLFLLLMFLAWRACSLTIATSKRARDDPELTQWGDLARMVQVCLVGYATSGAFLGLAYFDLYYALVTLAILVRMAAESRITEVYARGSTSQAETVTTAPTRFRGRRAQALGRLYT